MLEKDIEILKMKSVLSEKAFGKMFPDVYQRICEYTSKFSINKWSEKKYLYMNQIEKPPVCKICGKPVEFSSSNQGYKATCSRECDLLTKSKSHKKIWENYTKEEKEARLEQAASIREEHTGYRTAFEDPKVRKKANKTILERYGTTRYISSEGKERIQKHNNEHRDEINKKISTTWSKKTEEDKYLINKKRNNTCIDKFGVNNYSKTKEFSEFMSEKSKSLWSNSNWRDKVKNTCLEKYGVVFACLAKHVQDSNGKQISRSNKEFVELLNSVGISDIELEFSIKRYSYDIKVGDILIEVDPTYTHNSTIGPIFHNKTLSGKSIDYHYNKSKFAEENGYRCIHIWDWDQLEKVVYLLMEKKRIFARNCKIKEVDLETTNEFLNFYHLQNTCRNQSIRLGLYYKDELIEIMTFGKPRYNTKYQYELLRLCTKPGYLVVGGANKLFTHFISNYKPESIISYCDNSKFSGNVYTQLGMTYKSCSKPRRHWYNMKTKQHITDNLLRQRGADQLLGTTYGKGTNNSEIMVKSGFVEVYDCGQNTYIWKKMQ